MHDLVELVHVLSVQGVVGVAGGLRRSDHLRLIVVPGSFGLKDEDGDLLVGPDSSHRLEQWLCDLLRILGQLLGFILEDQAVAELLGAGIFWQGF